MEALVHTAGEKNEGSLKKEKKALFCKRTDFQRNIESEKKEGILSMGTQRNCLPAVDDTL